MTECELWKKLISSDYGCLSVFLTSQYGILQLHQSYGHQAQYYDQSFLLKKLVSNLGKAMEEAKSLNEAERPSGPVDTVDVDADHPRLPIEQEDGEAKDAEGGPGSAEETLIARAVEATSTDHPEESVHNVLSLETRVLNSFFKLCYWSSKGSESPMASDALVFKLKNPLTAVSSIQIRPFEAHFQRGSPIYAPMFVRFSFGDGRCETKDLGEEESEEPRGEYSNSVGAASSSGGLLGWNWTSKLYPMEQVHALQEFKLSPTLCCGGYVRVELLGRTQRQEVDNLYYVCLSYVKVLGRPVKDFGVIKKFDCDELPKGWEAGEEDCNPTLVYGPR